MKQRAGRYFVLISSVGGGRGGGRGAAAQPADPNTRVGAIAFALPRKDSNNNDITSEAPPQTNEAPPR